MSKWISVKERLPDPYEICLVHCEFRKDDTVDLLAFHGNNGWVLSEHIEFNSKSYVSDYYLEYITFYMGIPKLPKGGN